MAWPFHQGPPKKQPSSLRWRVASFAKQNGPLLRNLSTSSRDRRKLHTHLCLKTYLEPTKSSKTGNANTFKFASVLHVGLPLMSPFCCIYKSFHIWIEFGVACGACFLLVGLHCWYGMFFAFCLHVCVFVFAEVAEFCVVFCLLLLGWGGRGPVKCQTNANLETEAGQNATKMPKQIQKKHNEKQMQTLQ